RLSECFGLCGITTRASESSRDLDGCKDRNDDRQPSCNQKVEKLAAVRMACFLLIKGVHPHAGVDGIHSFTVAWRAPPTSTSPLSMARFGLVSLRFCRAAATPQWPRSDSLLGDAQEARQPEPAGPQDTPPGALDPQGQADLPEIGPVPIYFLS